ncbi:MAG: hypothetical protein JRI36_03680 [Deltaproteobacteria bacterium]|nr:hypothetical protein [Deltaproteobacteria bacterium]
MKNFMVILTTVLLAGVATSQASACWWDGYRGGHMRGSQAGYYCGIIPSQANQSFLKDTEKLREKLAAKQGEYDALLAQPKPDPKQAGKLSKEIAEIQGQLRAKARASGAAVPCWGGGPGPAAPGYAHGYCGWGCW